MISDKEFLHQCDELRQAIIRLEEKGFIKKKPKSFIEALNESIWELSRAMADAFDASIMGKEGKNE